MQCGTTWVSVRPGLLVGTVSKALELLAAFNHQRGLVGLSELARLTRTNKATCFRLMSELQAHGFVEQIGPAREYRLGPAVLGLAALREAFVPTRDAAMPALQHLADSTGETAHLAHRVGDRLLTLAFAYSAAHGSRVTMEDADHLPFHCTSSGIATLGFMSDADRDAVLSRPLPAFTPHTLTDAALVRDLAEQARKIGLAATKGTFELDVESIAVPLFGPTGNCNGALAVAAPSARMTTALRARILPALRTAATEVIGLWGGSVPPAVATLWAAIAR